jgi:hypothetical protein
MSVVGLKLEQVENSDALNTAEVFIERQWTDRLGIAPPSGLEVTEMIKNMGLDP